MSGFVSQNQKSTNTQCLIKRKCYVRGCHIVLDNNYMFSTDEAKGF